MRLKGAKTFSNVDFIAMNLRSNGKSMGVSFWQGRFYAISYAKDCDKCGLWSVPSLAVRLMGFDCGGTPPIVWD